LVLGLEVGFRVSGRAYRGYRGYRGYDSVMWGGAFVMGGLGCTSISSKSRNQEINKSRNQEIKKSKGGVLLKISKTQDTPITP